MAEIPSARTPLLGRVIIMAITGYQWLISSWRPPSCRFLPSCSEYAVQAVQMHGPLRGGWLAIKRVGKCHPWGDSGVDEVPGRGDSGIDDVSGCSGHQDRPTSF